MGLSLVLRLFIVLAVAVACGAPAAPAADPLAGTYLVGGGDSTLANVRALADAFAALHPGVRFSYDTALGSDAGVNLTANGRLDLGMASRELTAAEREQLTEVLVGVAGTGLAVNRDNPVKDLSAAQVRGIYAGTITNWSALGGANLTILPLIREANSPARGSLEEYVFGGKPSYGASVVEIPSGDQMRRSVIEKSAAIGLIGLHLSQAEGPDIHVLSIDGVAPTNEALRSGSYKVRRPLYVLYGLKPKDAVAQFIAFIDSAAGQRIINSF